MAKEWRWRLEAVPGWLVRPSFATIKYQALGDMASGFARALFKPLVPAVRRLCCLVIPLIAAVTPYRATGATLDEVLGSSLPFYRRRLFVGPASEPEKYRLVNEVRGGGGSALWKAEVRLAGQWEPVAVKVRTIDSLVDLESWRFRWADQVELLRFVCHPGVVGLREHFEATGTNLQPKDAVIGKLRFYLIMNWVDGTDLHDWLGPNPNARSLTQKLHVLQGLASAIDFLHSGQATPSRREIIHGDISPGNVMVTRDNKSVLVDFDLCQIATHVSVEASGTRHFVAPEVLTSGVYSAAADRYAFGALAYYVFTGELLPPKYEELRAHLLRLPPVGDNSRLDQLVSIFSPVPALRPSATKWLQLIGISTSKVIAKPDRNAQVNPAVQVRERSQVKARSQLRRLAGVLLALVVPPLLVLSFEGHPSHHTPNLSKRVAGSTSTPAISQVSTQPTVPARSPLDETGPPTSVPTR